MTEGDVMRKVLMSVELMEVLGADRVAWGEPDREGIYNPNITYDDEALGDALHAAIHPSHSWSACADPDKVYVMVKRFRAARIAVLSR